MKIILFTIHRYLRSVKHCILWVWRKLLGYTKSQRLCMFVLFTYLGTFLKTEAAILNEKDDIFQVAYRLKQNSLNPKDGKQQELKERIFFSTPSFHIGVSLVADIYDRGGGTIIDLYYTLLSRINNQEDRPSVHSYSSPPLCKSCYKIMVLLYPKLSENKAIKWSKDGCTGATPKHFDRTSVAYRLPRLAGYVKTHLSVDEMNKILKDLDLMTIQDSKSFVDFFMWCYKGNSRKAASYLEVVRAIGLRDHRRASELLYTCATKVGFMKIVKFLLEEEGANINHRCGEHLKTPIMGALVSKHKDTWAYATYMIKQQPLDLTYSAKIKGEELTVLDYLFQHVREKKIKDQEALEVAKTLLKKARNQPNKLYQTCVNELLRTLVTLPNFFDFIKNLVEEEKGLINYKGRGKSTVAMRCLEFQHKDSLVYFKYFFSQTNIDCGCMIQEDGQNITMFDLLFSYAKNKERNEIVTMAKVLIQKAASQEIRKLHASKALAGASCFPNFGNFIIFLVEKLGADVNYTANQMTPVFRALRIKHKDSWNYLTYLYKQGGVNPYLIIKEKKAKVYTGFFELMAICSIAKNKQNKVFPFLKSLYEQRKKEKDSNIKLKILLTNALNTFCLYPHFNNVVQLCVKHGANLNYRQKGVPLTIPIKVLTSPNMFLILEGNLARKIYTKDAFEYLSCMLSRPNIQHGLVVQDNDGTSFSLLEMLVINTKGKSQKKFLELIEILHKSNPLQKKDLGYLKNRKLFNSDNKFVLRRLQEMVGVVKKKNTSNRNNNKKKSKRNKRK